MSNQQGTSSVEKWGKTSPSYSLPSSPPEHLVDCSSTPISPTPSTSSNSSSNTDPKETPRHDCRVHFDHTSSTGTVVSTRPQLISLMDQPATTPRGRTMDTRQTSIRRESIKSSLEDDIENGDRGFPSKIWKIRGKGNALADDEIRDKHDKGFANSQHILSRLRKEHQVQKEDKEIITELKIRNAVLENEVRHAKRDKEAVDKSLGILIDSMARIHFSPLTNSCECKKDSSSQMEISNQKAWEREIDDLKGENRQLRRQNRELDNWLRYGIKPEDQNFEGSNSGDDKGKEKEVQTPIPTPIVLAGSWGPTEPSTSISATSSQEHADVGLHSLEDLLGEEIIADSTSSTVAATTGSSTSSSKQKGVEEVETRTVEEQLAAHRAAMQNFAGIPKPSILKVGFATSGSFRGSEYDVDKITPTYPTGRRRHRDFDHFGSRVASTQDTNIKLGIFNDYDERDSALSEHAQLASIRGGGGREHSFPEFFRHGIMYIPSENERGYLRTVHISNLPTGIHLRDVLARVRGGDVLSAVLLDTRCLTGGMSARVVFKTQEAAESYTRFITSHPIAFNTNEDEKDKLIAEITHLTTPTFPIPVHKSHHQTFTRCLRIPSFPPQTSISRLQRLLGGANALFDSSPYRKAALLELWLDELHTLHLQFSSVENAGWAWDVLVRQRLAVECEDDPCAGVVGELIGLVVTRPRDYRVVEEFIIDGESGGVGNQQRKRLAALANQKVEIPSFGGGGIQGKSWADEVEEEEDGDGEVEDKERPKEDIPVVIISNPEEILLDLD